VDDLDVAEWSLDRGGANDRHDDSVNKKELNRALEVYRVAVPLLDAVVSMAAAESGDDDGGDYEDALEEEVRTEAMIQLAGTYFQISETMALLGDVPLSRTMEYMLRAEQTFRKVLVDAATSAATGFSSSPHVSRQEVEESHAMCHLRLGIMTLDTAPNEIDLRTLKDAMGDDYENVREFLNKNGDDESEVLLGKELKSDLEKIIRAESHFDVAIDIYTRVMEDSAGASDLGQLQWELGMALQNKVTPLTIRGALRATADIAENALKWYGKALRRLGPASMEAQSIIVHKAQLLYMLSDTYLRLGLFGKASSAFAQSMDMHANYGLPPPEFALDSSPGYATSEETIQSYEQALAEYQDHVQDSDLFESVMDGVMVNEDTYYYERSDAYEGDLSAALGVIYLHSGVYVEAEMYLAEAVRLYTSNVGKDDGDDDDISYQLADAKYNLAMAKVQNGDFQGSATQFREALEIYTLLGLEGNDPMAAKEDNFADLLTSRKPESISNAGDDETAAAKSDGEHTRQQQKSEDVVRLSKYWNDLTSLDLDNETGTDEL